MTRCALSLVLFTAVPALAQTRASAGFLDGTYSGTPGSDYVQVFGQSILAGPAPAFAARTIPGAQHSRIGRAHSTTKAPGPVPHGPLSGMRGDRVGAATGKPHVGLESVPSRLGAR